MDTRDSSSAVLNYNFYSHDNVGNRLTNTIDDRTISYSYDDNYRLTEAVHGLDAGGQQTEEYSYDPIGNRLSSSNQVINKFHSADSSRTFTYDYENRLVRVDKTEGGQLTVVEYKYDPFGRRIERSVTENSTTTTRRFLYDYEDIIIEYDGSNTPILEYIHGPGIDEPLMVNDLATTDKYYYHADGLGSISTMSDVAGNRIHEYGYDSFGNFYKNSFNQRYTYTGREWDEEAGLYYYRARFYDPETGRFITKDPVGFAGGDLNVYSYVTQNPINYTDPTGQFPNPWNCSKANAKVMEKCGDDAAVARQSASSFLDSCEDDFADCAGSTEDQCSFYDGCNSASAARLRCADNVEQWKKIAQDSFSKQCIVAVVQALSACVK